MKHTTRIETETAYTRDDHGRKEVPVFRVFCTCGYASPVPHWEERSAVAERLVHMDTVAAEAVTD